MKVFGWQGYRHPTGQTREICAAQSMAAVCRVAGVKYPYQLFNLTETGNDGEIETAHSKVGTIFWKPLDDYTNNWASD